MSKRYSERQMICMLRRAVEHFESDNLVTGRSLVKSVIQEMFQRLVPHGHQKHYVWEKPQGTEFWALTNHSFDTYKAAATFIDQERRPGREYSITHDENYTDSGLAEPPRPAKPVPEKQPLTWIESLLQVSPQFRVMWRTTDGSLHPLAQPFSSYKLAQEFIDAQYDSPEFMHSIQMYYIRQEGPTPEGQQAEPVKPKTYYRVTELKGNGSDGAALRFSSYREAMQFLVTHSSTAWRYVVTRHHE